MSFKIKHENKIVSFIGFFSAFICFVAICIFMVMIEQGLLKKLPFSFVAIFVVIILALIVMLNLYTIEQTVGTTITVDNEKISIRYLLGKKTLAVKDIFNVQIERYQRIRRDRKGFLLTRPSHLHHMEDRLKMTIFVNNGKRIVLTDLAMTERRGLISCSVESIPTDEVSLFYAYQAIQSCLHNNI